MDSSLKCQLEFINYINLLHRHYQLHGPLSKGVSEAILDRITEIGQLFQKQHDPYVFKCFKRLKMIKPLQTNTG